MLGFFFFFKKEAGTKIFVSLKNVLKISNRSLSPIMWANSNIEFLKFSPVVANFARSVVSSGQFDRSNSGEVACSAPVSRLLNSF